MAFFVESVSLTMHLHVMCMWGNVSPAYVHPFLVVIHFASPKNLLHYSQASISLSHGFLNKEFMFTCHLSPVYCMASSVLDCHLVMIVILVEASTNLFH